MKADAIKKENAAARKGGKLYTTSPDKTQWVENMITKHQVVKYHLRGIAEKVMFEVERNYMIYVCVSFVEICSNICFSNPFVFSALYYSLQISPTSRKQYKHNSASNRKSVGERHLFASRTFIRLSLNSN